MSPENFINSQGTTDSTQADFPQVVTESPIDALRDIAVKAKLLRRVDEILERIAKSEESQRVTWKTFNLRFHPPGGYGKS